MVPDEMFLTCKAFILKFTAYKLTALLKWCLEPLDFYKHFLGWTEVH